MSIFQMSIFRKSITRIPFPRMSISRTPPTRIRCHECLLSRKWTTAHSKHDETCFWGIILSFTDCTYMNGSKQYWACSVLLVLHNPVQCFSIWSVTVDFSSSQIFDSFFFTSWLFFGRWRRLSRQWLGTNYVLVDSCIITRRRKRPIGIGTVSSWGEVAVRPGLWQRRRRLGSGSLKDTADLPTPTLLIEKLPGRKCYKLTADVIGLLCCII